MKETQMTCTVTLNAVREIREQLEKASKTLEVTALDRWATEGGFIDNDLEQDARQSLRAGQKFLDYAWHQIGTTRNAPQSKTLKSYGAKLTDTFRHNPHV